MTNEKNLKLINLFAFFSGSWFFVPVLLPFCKDHIGVGYQGMLLGEAAFAASCVIFDVPTGWISDVWRRKHALALGGAMNVFGCIVLLFATNIWYLIASQIIMGIGISLFNGTHTALLYDSLLSLQREGEYRKREGKRQALSLYGVAFAGTIGAFLYPHGHFLPIWLSIAGHCIVFVASCMMHEPERHKPRREKHPIADIIDSIRYVVHGHEDVGLVIWLAAVLYCSTKVMMWSQQPYYLALGIPESWFGVLMSLGWVLGGFSSHAAHLFDGKVNNFRALALALTVAAVFCLGTAIYLGYHGAALLILGSSCIYGILSPRVNEIINNSVESQRRATMLSTVTFLTSLLFIPVSSIIGWLSDNWGIQVALFGIAGWICLAGLGLFFWKRSLIQHVLKKTTPHAP